MLYVFTPVADLQVVIAHSDATAILLPIKVVLALVSYTSIFIREPFTVDTSRVLIFLFQWEARQLFLLVLDCLHKRVSPLVLPAFQLFVQTLKERSLIVERFFFWGFFRVEVGARLVHIKETCPLFFLWLVLSWFCRTFNGGLNSHGKLRLLNDIHRC